MTREQIVELFKRIKEFYSNFEVNSSKVDSWHSFLLNSNPAIVMRNFEEHVLKEKFPPTIAELVEYKNKTNVLSRDETLKVIDSYHVPEEQRMSKEEIRKLINKAKENIKNNV